MSAQHTSAQNEAAPISTAMVLAAGLGKRMRPLTDDRPKPMVPLAGRPLIDHTLDRLAEAGVARAVVNVHYKPDILEAHLNARTHAGVPPRIVISDERGVLLETGGGIVRAMPQLGAQPFLVCNSDTTWLETETRNLERLMTAWDGERMDALLLLAERGRSLGYAGHGDFHMHAEGRLSRLRQGETSPFVFSGTSIAHPRMFEGCREEKFSLNVPWDRAIAEGRLYGLILDGWWVHVGTPEALAEAERFIADGGPRPNQ